MMTMMSVMAASIVAFECPRDLRRALDRCRDRQRPATDSRTAVLPRVDDRPGVPQSVRAAIVEIVAVLGGSAVDLGFVVLDEQGIDPLRRAVYAATRTIQPGTTATYGDVARAIGRPDAARDVGAALARNPFPIVVPCHRVLGANGKLTGFSAPGGLETKRRMLELEGALGSAS